MLLKNIHLILENFYKTGIWKEITSIEAVAKGFAYQSPSFKQSAVPSFFERCILGEDATLKLWLVPYTE